MLLLHKYVEDISVSISVSDIYLEQYWKQDFHINFNGIALNSSNLTGFIDFFRHFPKGNLENFLKIYKNIIFISYLLLLLL